MPVALFLGCCVLNAGLSLLQRLDVTHTVHGEGYRLADLGPDAIAIVCTNMAGAPLVDALERDLGVPVYDSIAVVIWESLLLAGLSPATVAGWGRLFADPQAACLHLRYAAPGCYAARVERA